MKLVQVSLNNAGAYFTYKFKVQRGIRGKSKSKVDEVMVIGIPYKALQKYCEKEELIITNYAVYQTTMFNPILWVEKDSWTYVEKEKLKS